MPKTIGGVVYRHAHRALVVDNAGNPVESLTGGQVYATSGGAPLLLADYPSGAPLASVYSSAQGITPDLYIAFPADTEPEGFIDWPGDDIPPQPITATAAELTDWMRATIQAEVDTLVQSNVTLEERVVAAEARVDAAIAGIPTGGTSTGGGNSGLFEVGYVNGVCEYPTLADAQAAGMKDSDVAIHGPLPRNTPPVAWIRQGDRVDLLP